MRYSAFISYNHRDLKWARWVHRSLETYRVPKRLIGREGRFGPVAARLPPVFRDREELATSGDLAASVREALSQAETLIVICSPNGARSRWVNEEIRTFVALGRRDRIRCLVVGGEPHAADPAQECLPPALFEDGGQEPLAADLRKGQDGKTAARLKLIAGILELPYDELRQREAARRQKRLAAVAAGASLGFVVMAGLAIAAVLAQFEAERQRDIARQRTMTAERTVSFIKSMFEVSDPSEARGATVTAREVLDRGAAQIRRGLADEPAVQADLGITLGEVYGRLGLLKESDQLAQWAASLRHDQPGVTVRQLLGLAESKRRLGDYAAAIPLYERGIAIARREPDARADLLPQLLAGLGQAQTATDRFDDADRNLKEALKLDRAQFGAVNSEVARDIEAIGLNAMYAGKSDEARAHFLQALAIRRKTEGELSPSVADDLNNLAYIAYNAGDLPQAERFFRANLAVDEKVLGPDHPDVGVTLNNIGRMLIDRRAFAAAEPLLERAVAISRRQRDRDNDDMAYFLSNLAIAQLARGARDEGLANLEQALRVAREYGHPSRGPNAAEIAALRCRAGDTRAGLALLDQAQRDVTEDYPDDPWRSAWIENTRGECLLFAGRTSDGGRLIKRSTPAIAKRWNKNSYYGHIARARLLRVQS